MSTCRGLRTVFYLAIGLFIAGTGAALAEEVTIVRGVGANTNNGTATLNPGQFRFNPTLSLFDTVENALKEATSPCYLHIPADMPKVPVEKGDQGTITVNGHKYTVTFDDDPKGHFGVDRGDRPEEDAKGDFSAWAKEHRTFTNGVGLKSGVNCK